MMYQRDIVLVPVKFASPEAGEGWVSLFVDETEEEADEEVEDPVGAGEEEREQHGHDDHHDRGGDRLLARRPVDLGGLGADLTDEFAGGGSGHVLPILVLRIEKRPADLSGRRGWASLSVGRPSLQGGRSGGTRTHDPRFWR